MGADRAWMHPTVRHVTFSFTFKSHSNQGQFKSHQLTSQSLSPEVEAGRHKEKVANADTRRRRTCKRCTARLNQARDLLAVRLTAAPLCHSGATCTLAASFRRNTHVTCSKKKKNSAHFFIFFRSFKEIISVCLGFFF